VLVVKRRVELVRPMDAAAIDDHHDLFASFTQDMHALMAIWAQLLGIKRGHDLIEDTRRAILDSPDNAEPHAAGEAAPGTILDPRLAFEGLCAFAGALTQGAYGEASARRFAPPARPGEGQAPEEGCVLREHNDLATAGPVLQGRQCERAIGERSRGRMKAPGRTIGAYVLFFKTPRTLSRPSWTPVCWANTIASSRQLHCEERAPCWRGS